MARKAACLYQETRINPDATSPDQILEFEVPSHSTHYAYGKRTVPQRKQTERSAPISSEKDFVRQCLASHSHVHFRQRADESSATPQPHTILWRILDERRVLELQAVDLYYSSEVREEHNLTLRLRFPSAIRPKGVAFAESTGDKLAVFVIAKGGELFEFILPKQAFYRPNALESAAETEHWFSSDVPNALTYLAVHSLIAKSATELWASLHDGGLVRLERRLGDDGEVSWHESFFTEGGWKASVRGLIPWKSTGSGVRYDEVDYSTKSAIAICPSPDGRHVWTVCIDHALRAWDVQTGRVIVTMDLGGNEARDFLKPHDRPLDPAMSSLLTLIPSKTTDDYTLVTYSPLERSFRFLLVRDPANVEHGIENVQPSFDFTPPVEDLIGSNVWTLEDFDIRPFNDRRRKDLSMWILVRSGYRSHALHIAFDPRDTVSSLTTAWSTRWAEVASSLSASEVLDHAFGGPSEWTDPQTLGNSQSLVPWWISYLFYPGRFSTPTLEAALAVYQRNLNPQVDTRKVMAPLLEHATLRERISEAVGSAVFLTNARDGRPDYVTYNREIAHQWHIFYGVVKDLHKRRENVLSLAVDPEREMPWVLMADHVAPLRKNAEIDILWHNRRLFSDQVSVHHDNHHLQTLGERHCAEMGTILQVALYLREMLPDSALQAFRIALEVDLRSVLPEDSLESDIRARMEQVYSLPNFDISDDDYAGFNNSLLPLGGFSALNNDLFDRLLKCLDEHIKGEAQKGRLSKYGHRSLIRGAQETLELSVEVMESILLLLSFIQGEIAEDEMPRTLDVRILYEAYMEKYRVYMLLRWLATTPCLELEGRPRSSRTESLKPREQPILTVMQWLWGNEFPSLKTIHGPDAQVLTYWCRAWSLNIPSDKTHPELTAFVLSKLLLQGDLVLAHDFLKLIEPDVWSCYLAARVHLALGELDRAALIFKELQPELDDNFAIQQYDSANLIDPTERGNFGQGPARYLYHVMGLFNDVKAMSFVAEFASLALATLAHEIQQGLYHSKDEAASLGNDLLSRLFTSSLRISRFNEAFETLQKQPNRALRYSQLRDLLASLMQRKRIDILLSLPFDPDLAERVDDYLANLVTTTPVSDGSVFDSEPERQPMAHKVLYTWRTSRNDMRGAALCLWEYLEKLKAKREANVRGVDVDEQISDTYLALMNCLSLVKPEMAWLLVRPAQAPARSVSGSRMGRSSMGASQQQPKRKVVTLGDIQKEWQKELDRIADIEAGRFAYPIGDDLQDSVPRSRLVVNGKAAATASTVDGGGSAPKQVDVEMTAA